MKKQIPKIAREKELHITRPPRLEGMVKNAKMNPIRKEKKVRIKIRILSTKIYIC